MAHWPASSIEGILILPAEVLEVHDLDHLAHALYGLLCGYIPLGRLGDQTGQSNQHLECLVPLLPHQYKVEFLNLRCKIGKMLLCALFAFVFHEYNEQEGLCN